MSLEILPFTEIEEREDGLQSLLGQLLVDQDLVLEVPELDEVLQTTLINILLNEPNDSVVSVELSPVIAHSGIVNADSHAGILH